MRSTRIFILAVLIIVAVTGSTAFINAKLLNKVNNGYKAFAVIELFTSQGCANCPPADDLVAKIEKESGDKPVYILAYHVDYWNRLGWKDVFSDADYSKRQRDYAGYLHIPSVYTPQVIVNGKTEFVGSEEGTLRNAIKTNLQKAATGQLTLNASAAGQRRAAVKYITDGADKNTVLLLAILQKKAQTKVGGGENSGRTLSHVQIVRKLQKVNLNSSDGSVNVTLPHGFDSQTWELIGFLQDTSTGAITGAARASFAEVNAAIKNSK